MKTELFNVVATNKITGEKRFLARNKIEEQAAAIAAMAGMRQNIIEEEFQIIPVEDFQFHCPKCNTQYDSSVPWWKEVCENCGYQYPIVEV